MTQDPLGREAAHSLARGLGRRRFLQLATALGAAGATTQLVGCGAENSGKGGSGGGAALANAQAGPGTLLQPGAGEIPGDHYLPSRPDEVLWGYLPGTNSAPVAQMASGETITIDTVSHEGILEDQGKDPVQFFGGHGVAESDVLEDVVAIPREYRRTERDFDADGPHVVTGPVFVENAEPGDVLKIETLSVQPRVPYGVVSSRHGKGALALTKDRLAPAGITLAEVMPPVDTDGRASGIPTAYGNVSHFTRVEDGRGVLTDGPKNLRFPLNPFMGMMGVASVEAGELDDEDAHSVPPTLSGGNLDVADLGSGSALYLPVVAEGALFYVGDPHFAQGHGEVALTAVEGSLRGTFRLTVCKPGDGTAPGVAFRYPFGETPEHWVPIGLSDARGRAEEVITGDLDRAMRRAVVNALDFLEQDRGVSRQVAYAYLSAATNFVVSQVVDQTVGVHGLIRKADFD